MRKRTTRLQDTVPAPDEPSEKKAKPGAVTMCDIGLVSAVDTEIATRKARKELAEWKSKAGVLMDRVEQLEQENELRRSLETPKPRQGRGKPCSSPVARGERYPDKARAHIPTRKGRSRGKSVSETEPVLLLSDWHAEETVEPDKVSDLNAFGPDVFLERIGRLRDKACLMVDLWRAGTRIDGMTVAVLGDLISGHIHEELVESNDCGPVEAALRVQDALRGLLAGIADGLKLKRLRVPCLTGNHGRTTQKTRVSTRAENSFEWMVYRNLASDLGRDRRFEFTVAPGYMLEHEVMGRRIRLHHGDAFNYRDGVGGIAAPVNKGIARWNRSRPCWLDCFGHWHQAKDDGAWVSNGCLVGYNAFALRIKAQYEPPSQTMLFVEREHGKTGVCQLWLGEDRTRTVT